MANLLSDRYKEYLAGELPDYAAEIIEAVETSEPSVAVRLNPLKERGDAGVVVEAATVAVPWCAEGRYLDERPDFTHDPALHQGVYYVQDASSMAVGMVAGELARGIVLPEGEHLRYLDACAAPGGKTTAAISALPEGTLVVANEFDFRRAGILKENIVKWGYPGVVVSRGDTARFRKLPGWFHIIAADVPCSGEGMMRKDARACEQWTPALVEECVERQREIVANLWEALAPGGYLIYSTCTFNRRENEEMMEWMAEELGALHVEIDGAMFPGVVSTGSMLRFFPGRVRGEGLALGVLRKPADAQPATRREGKRRGKKGDATAAASAAKKLADGCRIWLGEGEAMSLGWIDEELTAVPLALSADAACLDGVLDVIQRGVTLGTLKGKAVVPAQSLALSAALSADAFPTVDVDREIALAYLRRESLCGFDAPRGMLLLMYGGRPLGFVNNLGNRANNLYPSAWRILH